MEHQKLPIFQGIFATATLSWLGWLSLAHMETDRTQDVVLERLKQIESEHSKMHKAIGLIPNQTKDRWTATEERIWQDGNEKRIRRLEHFHEPYMWDKK